MTESTVHGPRKDISKESNEEQVTPITCHLTHDETIDPATWYILMKHIRGSVATPKQVPTTRALFENTRSSGSLVSEDEGLCSLSGIAADIAKTANVSKEVRL